MLEPTEKNAAIAVYDSHSDAEEVIRELERGGFDMKKLSIVGKDYHTEEHAVGFYNMGDASKRGEKQAHSGAAYGVCCSDGPSSGFRESGR